MYILKVWSLQRRALTRGPSIFFSKKFVLHFCGNFFSWRCRCTIISEFGFDFERVFKLQQLPYFYSRTQALCKSSETIDDMKLDSSSDPDSSSENRYSSTAWKVSKVSAFSRIWTEYREILCICLYSVRMRENTDQKKLRIWTLFMQWITKFLTPFLKCDF